MTIAKILPLLTAVSSEQLLLAKARHLMYVCLPVTYAARSSRKGALLQFYGTPDVVCTANWTRIYHPYY